MNWSSSHLSRWSHSTSLTFGSPVSRPHVRADERRAPSTEGHHPTSPDRVPHPNGGRNGFPTDKWVPESRAVALGCHRRGDIGGALAEPPGRDGRRRPAWKRPADLRDERRKFIGQSEALNKTTFDGVAISELSGITFDKGAGVYYVQADRVGAGVPSRFFTVDIPVEPESLAAPTVQAVTTQLKADGTPATGSDSTAKGSPLPTRASYGRLRGAIGRGGVCFRPRCEITTSTGRSRATWRCRSVS